MTVDLGCFRGTGKTPRVRRWRGTYLRAEDACYDRDKGTRLSHFQTDAEVGPEFAKYAILMYNSFVSIAASVRYGVAHRAAVNISRIDISSCSQESIIPKDQQEKGCNRTAAACAGALD